MKGHGTENDFVLVPDANGQLDLTEDQVRALCDRRAGIGADGVIRVVRTDATDDPAAVELRDRARWFMDYRNSDGSLSEMCGNGVRVLGLYLALHADVDLAQPLPIATRGGLKLLSFEKYDERGITVDMGAPTVHSETKVGIGGQQWEALHVDMGNPHAVAFVDDLDPSGPVGTLATPPEHDAAVYPHGVNVEFVQRTGAGRVAMRVHERGSGETRSCGTGACAVAVATQLQDGSPRGTVYQVDVPGGRLEIVWTDDDRILMSGPAVLVAEGVASV